MILNNLEFWIWTIISNQMVLGNLVELLDSAMPCEGKVQLLSSEASPLATFPLFGSRGEKDHFWNIFPEHQSFYQRQ